MAASASSWFVVVRGRGAKGGIDDWGGLGDEPRSDHAGGTSVVGHVGLGGASVGLCSSGGLYTFRCGVAHHLMKSNLASMRLSPTVVCVYVLLSSRFFRVISAAAGRYLQFTTVNRSEPRGVSG